jgi:hypothetical protein
MWLNVILQEGAKMILEQISLCKIRYCSFSELKHSVLVTTDVFAYNWGPHYTVRFWSVTELCHILVPTHILCTHLLRITQLDSVMM